MTNPKKELANSMENATGVIVKKGEEIVKRNLLENVIRTTYSKNHLQKKIHIHDLEFYSTTYNCIGVRVSDLIGNKPRSFSNALRELARKIVWLTNLQSMVFVRTKPITIIRPRDSKLSVVLEQTILHLQHPHPEVTHK